VGLFKNGGGKEKEKLAHLFSGKTEREKKKRGGRGGEFVCIVVPPRRAWAFLNLRPESFRKVRFPRTEERKISALDCPSLTPGEEKGSNQFENCNPNT